MITAEIAIDRVCEGEVEEKENGDRKKLSVGEVEEEQRGGGGEKGWWRRVRERSGEKD